MESKLRAVRQARNLTLNQVAAAVDCDPTYLGRVETGTRRPSLELARALFEFFDGAITLGEIHDPEYVRPLGKAVA